MKKIIFGIFAHPDDEAFGPAGTLLQETKSGNELHLIMLTAGEAGINQDNAPDLAKVRLKEWKNAGNLLGAKSMHHLGYKDGRLDNLSMIKITEQIAEIVSSAVKDTPKNTAIEFMGFDLTGLSGHIDHIVASRAACLAFYKLKQKDNRMARIRLMCLPDTLHPTDNIDWLYMEKGQSKSKIDETIDARHLRDEIISIMRAHKSQRSDCERYIRAQGDQLGINYFIVKT